MYNWIDKIAREAIVQLALQGQSHGVGSYVCKSDSY